MPKNNAKIKFTAETGDFNAAIKKSNNEMAKLRAELKLNETQSKATGATIESLEEKHKLLSDQLVASQDKTEALNQKINKAVEIFGENSTEVTRLRTQLVNAQTAEEKIRQAIDACNAELEDQRRAAEETEDAHETLTETISRQQKELDDLKADYVEVVAKYGDTSDEAKALERSIGDLSSELKQNKTAFSDASDKADELDQTLDKADDSAEKADGGFTVLKGTIADLASEAIQNAIGKISEFISYLGDLPSATMELRQDMSTLTTSFDSMGFSTVTATDTWKELYAVFGEDDRAVETANHISKIADNQKDLNEWVTITTGIWGTYQDSLPVEGLAEAANETIKTGTVTGVLADALNWGATEGEKFGLTLKENIDFTELSSEELKKLSDEERAEYDARKAQYDAINEYNSALMESTSAEDVFNLALAECATEQERQQLITDTLTQMYGDAADTYRETSAAQMEAKEATAENILAENNLATAIEPVTTKFQELRTQSLEKLTPIVEKVSGVMLEALDWMQEHPVAMKAIGAAIGVIAVGLGALTAVVIAYTVAQWAMNSAILANPITWVIVGIVAAIAAVVAIIVVVVEYWDEIVKAVSDCVDTIVEAWDSFVSWITTNIIQPVKKFFLELWSDITETAVGLWDGVKETFSSFVSWIDTNIIQPVVGFFTSLWETTQEIWDTICNVVQTGIMLIGSIISAAVQIITLPFRFIWENCKDAVFGAWEWIKNAVTTAIDAVKNTVQTVLYAIKSTFIIIWESIKDTFTTVWGAIVDFITPILERISAVFTYTWETIKNIFVTVWTAIVDFIAPILETLKNIVELTWNTIKTVTMNVFNAIKNTVSNVWNGIKTTIATVVNAIKTTVSSVWNGIKSVTSSVFDAVKSTASSVWNGIKSTISSVVNGIKSTVSNIWNGIKSTTSDVFNGIKNTVTSVWNKIKTAITTPIEAAKNKVKSIVDAIKGFFSNMKLSLPHIKLPHFSVTGKLSISPPSVPKLSIEWYKEGGIMLNPTIFGMNGNSLMAGGEAGPEAILPIDRLEGYIAGAVEKTVRNTNLQPLVNAIEDLASRAIELKINDVQFATATASASDSVNGLRSVFRSRGLVLD